MNIWKDLLYVGLKEDGWPWDWTTLGVQKSSRAQNKSHTAKIVAKSEGIWAARPLVDVVSSLELNHPIHTKSKFQDGDRFQPKDILVEFSGSIIDLLAIERPFLNIAAFVSGIATTTQRFVKKVHQACPKNPPRITLTRKTLPHYRDLSIHGVRAGGGFPHRVSLSGGVLIKENHISAAGGVQSAIEGVRKAAPHGLKLEIEVRSLSEAKEALALGANGILLDNFSPSEVRKALKLFTSVTHRPFVEVSGGLTLDTISDYSIEGVDVLSVGSFTHSVQSVDLSFLMSDLVFSK